MVIDPSRKLFSFEFFPPREPKAVTRLQIVQTQLATLQPDFFSVTFGAGGSSREKTLDTILNIRENTNITGVPHISCMGCTKERIRTILKEYRAKKINHIVVLRGDTPSGMVGGYGDFRYACELIEFIRETSGDYFHIDVAAYPEVHPQAESFAANLKYFKEKIIAGADSALTQYFYNAEAYYQFIDECEKIGINIPIVPGIMPITNFSRLKRFSEACGADIPRWILKKLEQFADDRTAIFEFGVDVVSRLCANLLENGAPGLHIYTMNMASSTDKIWRNLGLCDQYPDD